MKRTNHRTLLPLAVLALVLLFGVIGCSRSGKVTGKVTYDGKTVPVGTITFHPEGGGKQQAATVEIVDGQYKAEKLQPGTYTITVSTIAQRKTYENLKKSGGGSALSPQTGGKGAVANLKKDKDQGAGEKFQMPGAADIERGKKQALEALEGMIDVPPKYADKEKSGLTVEIKTGSQENDINLQ